MAAGQIQGVMFTGEEDLIESKGVIDKSGFEPGVISVVGEECFVGGGDTVGRVKVEEGKWSSRKIGGGGEVNSLYSKGERGGVWVGQTEGVVSCVDWRVEGVASQIRLGGTDRERWDTAFLPQWDSVCVVGVSTQQC